MSLMLEECVCDSMIKLRVVAVHSNISSTVMNITVIRLRHLLICSCGGEFAAFRTSEVGCRYCLVRFVRG